MKEILKGLIDIIPIINSLIGNLLEDSKENPKGKIEPKRAITGAILGAILIYAVIKGFLTPEQAEAAIQTTV